MSYHCNKDQTKSQAVLDTKYRILVY